MHIEVDQSGKMERMSHDTIIASSNEKQYCIKIPKEIKQEIFYNYKNKIKQLNFKLFSIGVYYCIEKYINSYSSIIIDNEYQNKNELIKSILISYIKKQFTDFDHEIIRFSNIGKKSNAHHVAIETFRGEHKPNEILTQKEIWRLLK